jgi:biotin carboxyl carrier protein
VKIEVEGSGAADAVRDVRIGPDGVTLDGRSVAARMLREAGALTAVEIGGVAVPVRTAREGDRVFVWCAGRTHAFRRATERGGARGARSAAPSAGLFSPMPGRVRKILVARGDAVVRGQVLLVLEAMKMEHAIRSPRDGRVARLLFREGDLVEAGVPVAEILSDEGG